MLGFDTVIAESGNPQQWLRICNLQKRILLTRARKSDKLKAFDKIILILSDRHAQQLNQIITELQPGDFHIFSRCLCCNRKVYPISKELVIDRLPPKVRERADHFTHCRKCGKIFWKGTHFVAMLQFLSREIDGLKGANLEEFVLTEFC